MTPEAYADIQARLLAAVGEIARLDILSWAQAQADRPMGMAGTEQDRLARRVCRWALALRGETLAFLRSEMGDAAALAGIYDDELVDLNAAVFGPAVEAGPGVGVLPSGLDIPSARGGRFPVSGPAPTAEPEIA